MMVNGEIVQGLRFIKDFIIQIPKEREFGSEHRSKVRRAGGGSSLSNDGRNIRIPLKSYDLAEEIVNSFYVKKLSIRFINCIWLPQSSEMFVIHYRVRKFEDCVYKSMKYISEHAGPVAGYFDRRETLTKGSSRCVRISAKLLKSISCSMGDFYNG